ncbi:hypothetical protein EZZ75_01795 [Neisseria meningitidis]|nr:hypothetical protein [Neisseria meningitidis]
MRHLSGATEVSGATESALPSFPRKWESRTQNLKKPFYPISFRPNISDRFPPRRDRVKRFL